MFVMYLKRYYDIIFGVLLQVFIDIKMVWFIFEVYESVYFCGQYSVFFMENDLVLLVNKLIKSFKINLIIFYIFYKVCFNFYIQ